MKYVRYGEAGQEWPGLIAEDGTLRDLSQLVADIDPISIADGSLAAAAAQWPTLPVVEGSPRLGPPITAPGKFLGVGLNYADHAAEAKLPVPEQPVLFFKATSCINGPDDDVILPEGADTLDWEVELGFVIGKPAYRVTPEQAREHIFGYLVVNDISERTWQIQRSAAQWTKGKSHDTFGPIGPWLVSADEIADPRSLDLWLKVNGETMQSGNTRHMVFDVFQVLADASQYMRLMPGDIITTGTPPGVAMGMKPPRYLRRGDVMELSVAGLGAQRQRVV
ncbi:fumarylacetoacetate hydrolase family protein [Verticiella sediminum]|uniref:Fumarylacetoacetate hydrolase family protein n=1 Tax=Verticiella sediminum TaxID=1247510 RepID=A0A556AMR0_9BURK|nr:fumarylacetoacetate hydrolase family protein [Verticiella sediminum]TSH94170.1 fumarylacetoacetate hydrolase family protein [Verticiella sediminum]